VPILAFDKLRPNGFVVTFQWVTPTRVVTISFIKLSVDDEFSFQNTGIQKWLSLVAIASLLLAIVAPPSFWLCGIGAVLLVTGQIANSARTNQWMSWEHEGSLNWFEGWAASTGAVLIIVPLTAIIVRSAVSS
jgi:hypothetical protein